MNNEMIERCVMAAGSQFIGEGDIINIIKAMREPTEEMIEAAFGKSDLTPHPFRTAWYNMIDCIIND